MPDGPSGEQRPGDAASGADAAAGIELSSAAAQLGRKGGRKRAENMSPQRRVEIARLAAVGTLFQHQHRAAGLSKPDSGRQAVRT